jgi:hypothetical protein
MTSRTVHLAISRRSFGELLERFEEPVLLTVVLALWGALVIAFARAPFLP